ncbi:MAG: A24 family peptidase [Nanoarchaeota archaeon]|nr:A24 family peptidase [Nanoarchaeota archaeon]
MIVNFLIILILIGLVVASIWDLKKREIPDWLNFSLIAIALFTRLIFSFLEKDISFFVSGVIYFAIFFVIAHLFYYARIFAGGDAKLLIVLGIVFAEPPKLIISSLIPSAFVFILNLLIVGAFYGLFFLIIYTWKNKTSFYKEFKRTNKKVPLPYLLLCLAFVLGAIILKNWFWILFSFLIILLYYLYLIAKISEKVALIQEITSDKLTEGDWLAQTVKIGNKEIKPTWDGLSKKDIALLRKEKKKVLIRQGIPFVPAFLIAFIITLLLGNVFEIIMALF